MKKDTVASIALCAAAAATSGASSSLFTGNTAPFLSIRGGVIAGEAAAPNNSTSAAKHSKSKQKRSKHSAKANGRPKAAYAEETITSNTTAENDEVPESEPQIRTQSSAQDKLLLDIIAQSDYYAVLGVSKSATPREITKAYRKRALQTHPDKTQGDRRAFDKVAEAHDVLSDETKRSLFDRYGKKGIDRPPSSHRSTTMTEELFRSMFGHGATAVPRNKNVKYQLEVTLEDLYSGLTRAILVEQTPESSRKTVQVHVPRGMASGEHVVLSGEMDAVSNAAPGDLIFLLAQRRHPIFTRKGHDLAMELVVSLSEALCGIHGRSIRHLNGRSLIISSAEGEDGEAIMIRTGDIHVLKGEGMPIRDTSDFGDLYIQYKVELPSNTALKRLNMKERAQLGLLLDKLEGKKKHANSEVVPIVLKNASVSDFGVASGVFQMQQDEFHDDDRKSPFGGTGRSFFWSSNQAANSNNNPFGGHNPFFGGNTGDGDHENVQCQQM